MIPGQPQLKGRLGEYVVTATVGAGSFGSVALATSSTGENVVVKSTWRLNDGNDFFRDRAFKMELRALKMLHAAEPRNDIVKLIDCVRDRIPCDEIRACIGPNSHFPSQPCIIRPFLS
jgi:hypothetical protein